MKESRPNKCAHCALPPKFHLTKVVNGEAVKIGMCTSCPKVQELKQETGWDLIGKEDGGSLPKPLSGKDKACPECGLTPAHFKESGRLGCPQCYEFFEPNLASVIQKLHRGSTHLGKAPKGQRRHVSLEEIEALRKRLDEHVSREEYEMAAVVRDQLKSLEA